MADNNSLVFYQQGAVAGLQMDKYSTNPGCVDSKNLDIFSDSQSVKGTAWSTPTAIPEVDWIDEDERGRFRLYEDGRVYDTVEEVWYNHDYYDAHAENINWQDGQGTITQPFGTPRKLFVKYVGDEWQSIVVITDTLKYYIPNDWIRVNFKKQGAGSASFGSYGSEELYYRIQYSSAGNWGWANVITSYRTARTKFDIEGSYGNIIEGKIEIAKSNNLSYNQSTKTLSTPYAKSMETIGEFSQTDGNITLTAGTSSTIGTSTQEQGSTRINCEAFLSANIHTDTSSGWDGIRIEAKPQSNDGYIFIRNGWVKENWVYLKPLQNRQIMQIDDKWYMQVDDSTYEEMEWTQLFDADDNPYWALMTSGVFGFPEGKDIVAITKTFDYRLVFVNDDENEMGFVYLVPAGDDILTFQQAWEFPGLKFINAVMVNGYSYVIADERGVRGLYIFYNGQTKKIVGADNKYTEGESIIDGKQIYNFTGPMLNWRGKVVAPTVNGIYMYGENRYGQNVGSFILKVDGEISSMEAKNNQLKVIYTEGANTYYKIYQDDINIRNYEQDWSITFPVQIGTHMLEKEIRDLELSYFLPNENTSFDVYVNINDYYFWTFTIENGPDLEVGDTVELKGAGNAELVFIEKNGNDYTFKLIGNMPYQTSTDKKIIVDSTEYEYTEMTHFKKIGSCMLSNDFMKGGKNRIFKITAENELPIVRKMQIRIDGHTDTHNSPLLYSVRLLSSQNDR